jgi:hypothetical protein
MVFRFEEWFFACPPDCRVKFRSDDLGGTDLHDPSCADDLQLPVHGKAGHPAEVPSLWQIIGVA